MFKQQCRSSIEETISLFMKIMCMEKTIRLLFYFSFLIYVLLCGVRNQNVMKNTGQRDILDYIYMSK